MTFEAWLKKQIHRDEPIGDLAKDYIDAKKPYEKCNRAHLDRWRACWEAYRALAEARWEYRRFKHDQK
jgi:hypothetical protein